MKGNTFFKQGDIRMAIKKYQNAEEMLNGIKPLRPDHTREVDDVLLKIYLNLAQCFLQEKENTIALSYCEKAMELDPSNMKALVRHGRASFRLNRFDIAEKSLTKALDICPLIDKHVITEELTEVQKRKALRHKASDLSVDVEYIAKKKDKPIPGAEEAICGIIACLNEGLGGKLTLVNKTKKKGTECEDFDKELHNYFAEKVGQTDNFTINGSYKDTKREVNVLPVDQEFLVYKSHAYKRSETSSFEIARTKDLISILNSSKREFPIIPPTFQYNKEIMTEGKMIEFKEVTAKNLIKNFDSRYGHRYISSFANTSGGRVLYGINDNGIVKGIEGIASIEDFHHEIARKVNAMYWFQQDRGQIKPVEGVDWKLEFSKVEGAPDGKDLLVIVMSIPRLERGIVFCKLPLCPVLDPKQKQGYRMMTFDEWSQYLQRFPECTDDFVERIASDLQTLYQNTVCKKQLYPWEPGCYVELDDIFVQLTIDIEIPKPCKPIKQKLSSYADIFKPEEQSMRYVLEGRPGLGKTTLCAKIAHDWSRKTTAKSPLGHIKLLFVLQLGQIHYSTNLEDAIKKQLLPSLEIGGTQKLRKALQNLGSSVVIVLDSLDEADPVLFEHTDYGNLIGAIKYSAFQTNRILVTTRPWRVSNITKIRSSSYERLELQGFSRTDIISYVRKFFGYNPIDVFSLALGERLIQYIEANKLVVDASVPILILQLCWYWQKTGGKEDIPQRWSQLYDNIFNIMFSSLTMERKQHVTKYQIVESLDGVAYEGLKVKSTKLVFSEDVIELPEIVKNATFEMGLISRKGNQEKSITFYHKSAQEKLAGEYLASHLDQLTSYLKSIESVRDAQQVAQVLIAASGCSLKAAECVLKKLIEIFRSELQSDMQEYIRLGETNLSFDESKNIQQYIELCLECNYEAHAKKRFNHLLRELFPNPGGVGLGLISFYVMQPYTAEALGYYLTNYTGFIYGFTLYPIINLSESMALPAHSLLNTHLKAGQTIKTLSDAQVSKICKEFGEKNCDTLTVDHRDALLTRPRDMLAHIQCAQLCEGLPSSKETNIEPIINGFKDTELGVLNLQHFQLGSKFACILQSIDKGFMQPLVCLSLPSIGVTKEDMTRLMTLLPKMPNLVFLDISDNTTLEPGKTIPALAKYFRNTASNLQKLQMQRMWALPFDMEVFSRHLQFASQLTTLGIDSNFMSDKTAEYLIRYLRTGLTHLGISVSGLTLVKHRELLFSLARLQGICKLFVLGSEFPLELMQCMAFVLSSCSKIWDLTMEAESISSPRITHEAWKGMALSMRKHSELRQLVLRQIALEKEDFEELICISKMKNYARLSYTSEYVPNGATIPQEDFFVLGSAYAGDG